MTVHFYLLTGLMLGFEYVAVEDTLVIDLLVLRVMIEFEGEDDGHEDD